MADLITGGALTFHKNGWARPSALYHEARAINKALEADVFEWNGRALAAEAELARRDAAERNHTAAKPSAAKDMREGRG